MNEWPDVEGGVRAYLRADADVQAALGGSQRVFFGIPKSPTWPLVVVSRVGGGDDLSDAPVDVALIQIDCWGEIDAASGHGLKSGCTTLVNAVRSALTAMTDHVATAACRLVGASVQSVVWLPDPSNDRPRYVVTAEVTALLP